MLIHAMKKAWRAKLWIIAAGFNLSGAMALAEVPEDQRVPLAEVEIAAFFPHLAASPGVRVWALKGSALDPDAVDGTGTTEDDLVPQGLGILNYTTIQGSVFIPNLDSFVVGDAPPWGLFCEAGGNNFASAQAELPQGTSLLGFRAWTKDMVPATTLMTSMWEVCQSQADPDTTDVTFLGGVASPGGGPGSSAIIFPTAVSVDTTSCFYPLLAQFGADASTCGPDLALYKVRLAWKRQIAPPPGAPTFTDVPTNHQFYQQIEALAHSGITGGCGGGNFCPNAALTRGQMAVFLAKALGLGWEPAGIP